MDHTSSVDCSYIPVWLAVVSSIASVAIAYFKSKENTARSNRRRRP